MVLVKNPNSKKNGNILFHDIGDYLDEKQKLKYIEQTHSISGISKANDWLPINPDNHGDWLDQRDDSFAVHIAIGDKSGKETLKVFDTYSQGVLTSRDWWCVNSSKNVLTKSVELTCDTFNSELNRYSIEDKPVFENAKQREAFIDGFVKNDETKISWSGNLKKAIARGKEIEVSQGSTEVSTYRPFTKQWLHFNRKLNERVYQLDRIYPAGHPGNISFSISGVGAKSFSCLMTKDIPSYDMVVKGQTFALENFQAKDEKSSEDLFQSDKEEFTRSDGITNAGLEYFRKKYPGEEITKEDIFYYIYGILHSTDYRERYADNLSKELPRIPSVKKAKDFWTFCQAGRTLGDLHVNYESADPYQVTIKQGDLRTAVIDDPKVFYRVKKWAFGKAGKEKDKSTVIYNSNITMENIPLEAYDYIVNGKPALEWVMERQVVKTDKKSGIVNDANDYANETMDNPAYPLELFQRVITVSLETMKIVRSLPKLDID